MRNFIILLLIPFLLAFSNYTFDGTNDEIDGGNVSQVTTGDVSIAAWALMNDADGSDDLIIGKKAAAVFLPYPSSEINPNFKALFKAKV